MIYDCVSNFCQIMRSCLTHSSKCKKQYTRKLTTIYALLTSHRTILAETCITRNIAMYRLWRGRCCTLCPPWNRLMLMHYNDVIRGAIAYRLFTQPFIQTQIKENIRAPRLWPLCGEFTRGPMNSPHKGPVTHLMTSSWVSLRLFTL